MILKEIIKTAKSMVANDKGRWQWMKVFQPAIKDLQRQGFL